MKNQKRINKKQLFDNLAVFSHKKVCAMVKADAYGHGARQVVELLNDKVFCFGVAKVEEGEIVRGVCDTPVVVVGKTFDFALARKNNLIVTIESEEEASDAVCFDVPVFLKIDCGMNRLGVETNREIKNIVKRFEGKKHLLVGASVHFSNTDNKQQTEDQYTRFLTFKKSLPKGLPVSFGGSGVVQYNHFDFDILRVGIGLYGYQNPHTKPVMRIVSFVEKVFVARKGEFLGYGTKFRVEKTGRFAIVPVGYADGLLRNLTGLSVWINDKPYAIVGNVCMDVCFVEVDDGVYVGDEVCVMQDAKLFANQLDTIEYEILTNFSKFRGEVVVE